MNDNEFYPKNEVQPGIAISPEVNPMPTPPRKSGWKILAIIAGLIIVAGGLGIFSYSKGYTVKGLSVLSPAKIWDNFYTGESAKIYNTTFTAEYSDPESLDDPDNDLGIVLKNIKVNLEGSAYANITNADSPEADGNLKFTVASGNSSFSSGIEYRAINKNVFYKIGDIPFLSGILGPENQNIDWVKIDLNEAKEMPSEEGDFLQGLTDTSFQDKIRKIWLDNRAIKLKSYAGREKINGVSTIHFRAELDKPAAKKAVMETISALAGLNETQNLTGDDQALMNAVIEKLVDKIEIKELDVWVGAQDQNLYKLHLVSNAPSIVSLVKLATASAADSAQRLDEELGAEEQRKEAEEFVDKLNFNATFNFDTTYSDYGKTRALAEPMGAVDLLGDVREKSMDAKRLADIRQTASALELYFNDNNSYPPALSNLVPTYIGVLLAPPTPPGGTCTAEQNTYTYSFIDSSHYRLTFCLGNTTGGVGPGPHTLSEQGIN